MSRAIPARGHIDFTRVASAALSNSETICRRWLPKGRMEGNEWVALNPRRPDHRLGSFKVNLVTGKWGDFADGAAGGDLISLAAYLFEMCQRDAAIRVAEMVGTSPYA